MLKFETFKRLRDFSTSKIVPAFYSAGYFDKADKIKSCGEFVITKKCNTCGTYHFDGFSSCHDRFCPICQKKKSLKYIAKLMPILIDLSNKGYYIQLMNFTIKDSSDLQYNLDLINKAFRYMQGKDKKLSKEFKTRFIGGIKSLEIKKGANSKEWHPHYHCIVVKKEYSNDFEFMRNAWEHSLKVVTGKDKKLGSVWVKGINASNRSELLKSLVESLKYITKYDGDDSKQSHTLALNTLDNVSVKQLVESTSGVRQISTWGLLHNLKSDDEDDTLENLVDRVCLVCSSNNFKTEYLHTDTDDKIVVDFTPSILSDKLKENYLSKLEKEKQQKELEEYKKNAQLCFDDFDIW